MFTLELYCFFCFQSSHASEKRFYVYVRASVAKKYPAITVIVFFQLLSSTMQCGVFALIVVRDPTKWKLNLDIGLIGVSFSLSLHPWRTKPSSTIFLCFVLCSNLWQSFSPLSRVQSFLEIISVLEVFFLVDISTIS
ncbi:uncharacterized protein LOC106767433 isoform X3 [Vigna radiata var. radiata]|uniref:Uncharacterized protein LOC106767433 isoform X3 n=1 Tax=Vigna radiata var. radiata TaxID=3916 RepID=A0A3Q0F958_VIGRR|nr:uncharacterized protein LOC106767433 isoform X3 [Vigna radiata var. radiata]